MPIIMASMLQSIIFMLVIICFPSSLLSQGAYNSPSRTKTFSQRTPKRRLLNTFKHFPAPISYGVFVGNRWVAVLVAAVFFAVAFLILFQQEVTFGRWFQIDDLHHETFALAAAALGVGVLIGASIAGTNQSSR